MTPNRRTFIGAAAAAASLRAAQVDWSKIRARFPWAEKQLFMNPAGWHPMPAASVRAMERYLDFKLNGPGDGRGEFAQGNQETARSLFASLINASPDEISFVPSTLVGENLVVAGLGIPGSKWNVVIDELHYEGSIYMYRTLERDRGLDLRIVKQREGRVPLEGYEEAVDKNTRLVACSLVSYQNGYRADVRSIANLAHSRGAYVYCDVIQSAGAVPIDVKQLDLDFCACSGYKWLMGDRGLGYLYVRRALHGDVVRRTQYGDRQFDDFRYHLFPYDPPGPSPASWKTKSGAGAHYEVGNIANIVAAGHAESLKLIHEIGIDRIRGHAEPLVEKLRSELPRRGYPCLTPPGTPTPISAFVVARPGALGERLRKANIDVKIQWNQMRVSVSVYHTAADIDRFLEAAG
jgi:selenocysteine lyase/cysteine desulfurase